MNFVRKHIFISGRVQGVCFRQETRLRARYWGLAGFVKNLKDGRVEIVVEGEEKKTGKLIKWVKRGPAFAKVEKIQIIEEQYKREFKKFDIRY